MGPSLADMVTLAPGERSRASTADRPGPAAVQPAAPTAVGPEPGCGTPAAPASPWTVGSSPSASSAVAGRGLSRWDACAVSSGRRLPGAAASPGVNVRRSAPRSSRRHRGLTRLGSARPEQRLRAPQPARRRLGHRASAAVLRSCPLRSVVAGDRPYGPTIWPWAAPGKREATERATSHHHQGDAHPVPPPACCSEPVSRPRLVGCAPGIQEGAESGGADPSFASIL